ncbi:MAG: TlpA disulfide reductase family protein [Spirosomataceae bacterium]
MKSIITCLIVLLIVNTIIRAQQVKIVKWPEVQAILTQQSDTTYIVNFWATWCKPCVAELPYFEKIQEEYQTKNIKILLISMDFASEFTTRVVPFVAHKKLISKVWVLNEPDANSWIDKVNSSWSGAIPATLIFNNFKKKSSFFEQKLEYNQLVQEVGRFL